MAKFQITSNFLDEKSDSCAKVDQIWPKLSKGSLIFPVSIHGFLRIDLSYWCLWLGTEWVQSASPVSIARIHLHFPLWSQFSSFSCINCQALPKALRTHNAFVLSGSTRYSKDTSTEKCRKSCKTCKSHFSKRQQDNNNLKTTTTRLSKKKLCYKLFLSTWEWNPWCPEVFSLKTSVHVLNADPLSSLPAPAYCTIVASPSFILATPLCSVGFVLWQRFSQLQYPPRCAKCMLGMQTPCFIILWESNPSSRRCT